MHALVTARAESLPRLPPELIESHPKHHSTGGEDPESSERAGRPQPQGTVPCCTIADRGRR